MTFSAEKITDLETNVKSIRQLKYKRLKLDSYIKNDKQEMKQFAKWNSL